MDVNKIQEFIVEAQRLISTGEKEDKITSNFTSYLRLMFPENPQWVNHYVSGIETSVTLYRRGGAVSGSIDVYVDSTVIEFEKDLRSIPLYHHGLDQVKEYCAARIVAGDNISKIYGVLSDTINWYFYSIIPTPGLAPSAYTALNINLNQVDTLSITAADVNNSRLLGNILERYLGRKEVRKLTAEFLAEDFGLDTTWGIKYLSDSKSFVDSMRTSMPAYSSMIQDIWQHFVEGIDMSMSAHIDSYVYEFYIASLAKLLCANILTNRALHSSDNDLVDIVSGEYFQRLGYSNFVEYDYFGWINEHLLGSSFIDSLRKIQEDLSIYDYSVTPGGDIFGKLLSQLSIDTKRILLGQELTPPWLSEALVENVYSLLEDNEIPRFIDMCCGSGSMIIATIKLCSRLMSSMPLTEDEQYKLISSCALGIDIDPLAVLLAKINWVIHTQSYCSSRSEIVIPIYHADSLFISSPVSANPHSYTLDLDGYNVTLPRFLLESPQTEFFSLILERLSSSIDSNLTSSDCDTVVEACYSSAGNTLSSTQMAESKTFFFDLHTVLYNLHIHDRNGIWAFLLKNSFKPALLENKFNGIVSNTPWMTLSEINNNPYKNQLTNRADRYQIRPVDSAAPHLELATVFLLHSIEKYLTDNAVFGCVLPRSVMNGKQHDKFRAKRSFTNPHTFSVEYEQLWDLPESTFNNRAVAIFGHKAALPSPSFSGRKYSDSATYSSTPVYTISGAGRTVWSFDPPQYNVLQPTYFFEEGADILPRSFFFFDLTPYGGRFRINPLQQNASKYGFFLQNEKIHYTAPVGIVPAVYFSRTVVSNVLLPFNIVDTPLALIPYKKDPISNSVRRLTQAEYASLPRPISSTYSRLSRDYRSLVKNEDLYGNKKLNFRNKLVKQNFTSGHYLVVYGAGGSDVTASYLRIDNATSLIFVDQTLYYREVCSEDEAVYLTGLLNSPVLTDAIAAFQPSGLFGERHIHSLPMYFIPPFDPTLNTHMQFVDATKLLMTELQTTAKPANVIASEDPNSAYLGSRRRVYKEYIKSLNSYSNYESISRLIIV